MSHNNRSVDKNEFAQIKLLFIHIKKEKGPITQHHDHWADKLGPITIYVVKV